MNLSKELKSVVFVYEDEECVRLTGKEAEKFRDVMRRYATVYSMALLTTDGHETIDLENHFEYEQIRNALKPEDISTL